MNTRKITYKGIGPHRARSLNLSALARRGSSLLVFIVFCLDNPTTKWHYAEKKVTNTRQDILATPYPKLQLLRITILSKQSAQQEQARN